MRLFNIVEKCMATKSKLSVLISPDGIDLGRTDHQVRRLVKFVLKCKSIKEWMSEQKLEHSERDQTILKNMLIAELCCEGSPLFLAWHGEGNEIRVFEKQRITRHYQEIAGKNMDESIFRVKCNLIAKHTTLASHPTSATWREFLAFHGVWKKPTPKILAWMNRRAVPYPVPNPPIQYLIDTAKKRLCTSEVVEEWSYMEARLWPALAFSSRK